MTLREHPGRAVQRAVAHLVSCRASGCGIRILDRWQHPLGAHIDDAASFARCRLRAVWVPADHRVPRPRINVLLDNPRVRAVSGPIPGLHCASRCGRVVWAKESRFPERERACLANRFDPVGRPMCGQCADLRSHRPHGTAGSTTRCPRPCDGRSAHGRFSTPTSPAQKRRSVGAAFSGEMIALRIVSCAPAPG